MMSTTTMMTEAVAPETKKPQLSHPSVDGQLEVIGGFTVEPDLLRDTESGSFALSSGSSRFNAVKRHGKIVFKSAIATAAVFVVGGSFIKLKSSSGNDVAAAAVLSTKMSKEPQAQAKTTKGPKSPKSKQGKTKSAADAAWSEPEPNEPADRVKFAGTAQALSDCTGISGEEALEECEQGVLSELTDSLVGILCANLTTPFMKPCRVSVTADSNSIQGTEERRSLVGFSLYDFVLYLTTLPNVGNETIVTAATALFDVSEGAVVQTLDTIPLEVSSIPLNMPGYSYLGQGYCSDYKGDYFSSACEYTKVFDVQTCATLCTNSPCFVEPTWGLAGIDWYPGSSGGTCYCLKNTPLGTSLPCPYPVNPQPYCGHQNSGNGQGGPVTSTYPNYASYQCFRLQ